LEKRSVFRDQILIGAAIIVAVPASIVE